ncbi:reverse transcriptase domain-containing protein [Tanacetum coccineum]
MSVRLVDRSFQYPAGIAENMLVEDGKFTFPADFVILKMEEDSKVPLILGRPFLHTTDAVIRVKQKQLNLGVGTERMIFNIDSAMKHSYSNDDTCFSIDEILEEDFDALLDEGRKILHSIKGILLKEEIFSEFNEFIAMTADENSESESDTEEPPFEKITINTDYKIKTSLEEPPTDLKLKPLPDNLEYVFLEEPSFLLVIISSKLSSQNKSKVVSIIKKHKEAFAWKTTDIPGSVHHSINIRYNFWMTRNQLSKNKEATFQRCMLAIFHDMIKESVEVFMDDFSVFRDSFDKCLNNLDKMLQRCKDAHLVLNWEKCHFMVKEGDMLGHKVSSAGLEADKAKIDVISKLSPLLISKLLEKDTPFEFNDECQKAFEILKEKLTCAPVIVTPNWNISFELICDASDFAVGYVLGTENVAADQLSRIENDESSDDNEVDDNFPGETLMEINTKDESWFADFANYLGIDFMRPFLKSQKFEYILVAVDYVSKWAEAQALPTNDARVVVTFLKKLFCHFGMPKALISDRGTQFCDKIIGKTIKRYGVNHRFSTSYHPQTSSQVENMNIAFKRILEKTVKDNPAIWSRKLDDAFWAFRTAYKTPTGTTPYKLIYGKNCHFHLKLNTMHSGP